MPHDLDLILTLTGGFTAALALGILTQRLGLSPIVGYLVAGILVGPFTPGFVADNSIATQAAEIGVILLMFGVGLHFHLKDLMAVRRVAIPGAVAQIAVATILGAVVTRMFGWSWTAGIVFGMAISVASTVVLTRVLADNQALHTPSGHIAIGWLIVEDLFTILVLVLLPALYGAGAEASGSLWTTLGLALLKLSALVVFTLVAGQRVIPWLLGLVARMRSRELFTLTVLVLALGIAVGSAKFFGASMALGAFLAGMVVGQSEFSARAASDALPMRDAFAVLFFVSVGMLFDPAVVANGLGLMLATLAVVVIGKPIAAIAVVLFFGRPIRSALSIAVALAQIGEFSFILAALAISLGILPTEATNALVVASVVSITINPLLYKAVDPVSDWLASRGWDRRPAGPETNVEPVDEAAHRVVVVGYGPVGRTLSRILRDNEIQVVVIEMNIETVQSLLAAGRPVVYGDAAQREILHHAGIEEAQTLIIAASSVDAGEVVRVARELNPKLQVFVRTAYLREAAALRALGVDAGFSGEGEIAIAMAVSLMERLGATAVQIDAERDRIRRELFVEPENGAQTDAVDGGETRTATA
ncbi:MAG: cation:proton antiporter [bacterium]|nr:cation:proton antiporter [bacterium]